MTFKGSVNKHVLPTLFIVMSIILNNIVEPESDVTILDNIVDNTISNIASTTVLNNPFSTAYNFLLSKNRMLSSLQ